MPRLRATETPPKRGLRRAADPLVVVVARNCADRMMRRPLPIDRESRFPVFFFLDTRPAAACDGGPHAGQGRGLKRRGVE